MTTEKKRIVHVHIPKTAGTALRTAFAESQQDKLRIFPHYDERMLSGVDPEAYDLFSGHFGYKNAAELKGEMVTVLRDPVDRFVSIYYFWRELHAKNIENSINTRIAAKFSLEDYVNIRDVPSMVEAFQDAMTMQLAHGATPGRRLELYEAGLTKEAILTRAIENIRKFAVIGVQEDMGSLNIGRVNVTLSRSRITDIPWRIVRKIEDWMPLDMELYQHVQKHY